MKERLEPLSDGVFAIVMTLLVIEIHVPELHLEHMATNSELVTELVKISPLFLSYFISFLVLAMFWTTNQGFLSSGIKNVNRTLVIWQMSFLAFIALTPFSAHLLGTYPKSLVATVVYGINVLIIGLLAIGMYYYAQRSEKIETKEISTRLKNQIKVRILITPAFTLLGILAAFVYIPASYFFFAFPIIFNIIPGILNWFEKTLGFNLGE